MSDADLAIQIKNGNAAFTNKLYKILSKQPGNVFFSPFGLHAILSMAYQAAQNETSKVLRHVLEIPDAPSTAVGYRTVFEPLQDIDYVTLWIANKIYVRKEEEFLEEFEKNVRENFFSQVETVDFENKSETVDKINQWVEEATYSAISNLVDESSINEDTALFLVNTIYFQASWLFEFSEESTKTEEFYLDAKQSVQVQMMHGRQSGMYHNNKDLDAQIYSVSYEGDKFNLVIILPKKRDGIQKLEAKLATKNLLKIFDDMRCEDVDISLPKFKFATTIDFDGIVKEIGLSHIFDDEKADFNKMLKGDRRLSVGKILQKACIDVNEQGSEASAAAFMTMDVFKSAHVAQPTEYIPFVVDHPAIFMIVECLNDDKNILFYGRLSNPEF